MRVFLYLFSLPSSSFSSYQFTPNRHSDFIFWGPPRYPSAAVRKSPCGTSLHSGAKHGEVHGAGVASMTSSHRILPQPDCQHRYKHTLQWRVVMICKAFGSLSICSGLDRSKISLLACEDAAISGFIFFYTSQHFLNLKLLSLHVLNKEEQNRNMCPEEKSFGGGEGRLPIS